MASGHLLLSCAKRAATTKIDLFAYLWQLPCALCSLILMTLGSKTADERHFYMALCAKEHYSKRELERQIGTSYYERSMISAKKPMPESVSHDVRESILDTYVLEFLDLREQFSEIIIG